MQVNIICFEAAYDNSVYSRKKGQWIKVVKQAEQNVAGK
jgi:hypothetical protein